ncbi:MAG: ATP-binding cassette domain-containing protein [Lachnospiraceae bacterium]|nr:ATP-binding cassette domain-containing protein [Lachnospiraceae bacterium]
MSDEKKVLLRINNLKQYFPLKKRGLYVKANDGITLDIYEGEVFGLVGESGCGKSTLGRTILQLYKQTDGKTMYYGKTLDDLAPKYMLETVKNLEKKISEIGAKEKKRDELQTQYDKLSEREQFEKHAELDAAKKSAADALLDVANIVGGFMTLKELGPVKSAYETRYNLALKRRGLRVERSGLQAERDDVEFEKKDTAGLDRRIQEADQKIEAMDREIAENAKAIDALREPHLEDPEFQKFEALRDDGVDLARLTYNEIRLLRQDLQIIFQDPYSSLNPRMTVGQIIGEGLTAHNIFRKNNDRMKDYILKVMDDCGLQGYFLHRFPYQFSGGQRQRISIARALAVKPKFVVCDEAVSALDVSVQSQIINLLQDLGEQQELTYLFITHDLSVVKYISDRIGVMYLGNMVELAASDEIFRAPAHPYTRALLDSIPTTEEKKEIKVLEGDIPSPVNPPAGCKFHTRCKFCTEICEHVTPEWEEIAPDHFVACHHRLTMDS